MAIVGGFDVHRAQITFDYLDVETGEATSGQIRPATRLALRSWLMRFGARTDVAFAVEGCTGWRFVVEELQRAGVQAHLAETTDTATLRGRKQRAKTDRADARLLRTLLLERRLPEAWIAPAEILEVRALTRLYVALMADYRAWQQRIHAQLFHQGVPVVTRLVRARGAAALIEAHTELSPAGRQLVNTATTAMAALSTTIVPLRRQLEAIGAAQPAVRALVGLYGIGWLTGTIIWAELGDCHRFSHPDQVVRFAGLDVTVWSSSSRRSPGHLARQGSPQLRWALFEAAKCASRVGSPDYAYYTVLRTRLTAKQTALSVARKLAHRCYHTLRAAADQTAPLASELPSAAAA
jgi:transposase